MMTRLKLIWWALLGRPIIYGCKIRCLELDAHKEKILVDGNTFGPGVGWAVLGDELGGDIAKIAEAERKDGLH